MNRELNTKVSKNFWLAELLPPELFKNPRVMPIWYLTEFLATVPQKLRDELARPITVNSWFNGGSYSYSGLRLPETDVGAKLSLHRFGLAVDVKVEGISPQEVVDFVKSHRIKLPEITAYERTSDTPTWCHLDGRRTGSYDLLEVPGK